MTSDRLLVRTLLACYPGSWRRRYGEEYAALLSDLLAPAPRLRRPVLIINVLRGAVDARISVLGGVAMLSRSPLSVAVWATGVFTVAGIGFQKMSEDTAITAAADHHSGIGWAFTGVLVAAAVALAAMVITALPTAMAMLRGQGRGSWKLAAVPVVAFAAWYGVLRLALLIARGHSVHSAANIAAAALVIVSGVATVAATAWAAIGVLRRVGVAGPPGLRPVMLTALAVGMAGTTVACLAWGLTVQAANPAGVAAHDGILASPFVPSWIATLALMAAATALAATSVRQQVAADAADRGERH